MTLSYNLVGDSRGQTLTVIFSDATVTSVPSSHANFSKVLGYLVDTDVESVDENRVKEQLDVILAAGTALKALSERVSVAGNSLYFDGDKLDSALANHILRLLRDGDQGGWVPLVLFLEKLATNPALASRDSLYSWIADRNLTITESGDFVAYKGVGVDENGVSVSIHSGRAFVNGTLTEGRIPNPSGAVITMPRGEVDANVGVGCSTGLHAGTWKYASEFSRGRVLEVHINPRDVVSVPSDCEHQKLRVSRYTVVNEIEQEYSVPTVYSTEDVEDEDYLGDYWGDHEDDEDDEEYEEWQAAWDHDPNGTVREELGVEFPEVPEDVLVEFLQSGYSLDEAEDRIWPDGR